MDGLLQKDQVFTIVGAAMEVYNVLGPGFLEAVYQETLEIELAERGVPFVAQELLRVHYKHHVLQKVYVPDLLVFGSVLVELKALDALTGREQAQLLNYLKATNIEVGLLVNFGAAHKLDWRRMVLTRRRTN